jgi:GxxExxY protein
MIELESRSLSCAPQRAYPVLYKGLEVGLYIPDLIVHDSIIVEIKSIDRITNVEIAQVLNHLRITKLPVGLILNFKRPKLEWKRIALSL